MDTKEQDAFLLAALSAQMQEAYQARAASALKSGPAYMVQQTGLSKSTIIRVCKHGSPMDMTVLLALSRFFGIEVSALFARAEDELEIAMASDVSGMTDAHILDSFSRRDVPSRAYALAARQRADSE